MSSKGGRQYRKRARSEDDDETGRTAGVAAVKPHVAASSAAASAAQQNTFSTARALPSSSSSASTAVGASDIVSDRSAAPFRYGGGAFATTEVDAASDRDGQALYLKQLQASSTAIDDDISGAKQYRGMASYASYMPLKNAAEAISQSKVTGTKGPLRAPTNVRGIIRIDYQPDVCKDYKETGYCGFGDSCIYLHDRGDYKQGWQLDKEWDEKQKAKAAALAAHVARGGDADEFEDGGADASNPFLIPASERGGDDDDDSLPFACYICRQPFVAPVQTQCGHFFCESCAMQRFATDGSCAACGKQTQGIFNAAPTKLRAAAAAAAADAAASSATEDALADVRERDRGNGDVDGSDDEGAASTLKSGSSVPGRHSSQAAAAAASSGGGWATVVE